MSDTEKLILEKLDVLSRDITSVKEEVASVKEEVASVKEEVTSVKEEVASVKEEVASVKEEVASVKAEVESVKQKVTMVELTLENDINRKIDIIGEGHDFLKQRLDQALQMEKKRESMELELINLKMEVKKIKEKLNIA